MPMSETAAFMNQNFSTAFNKHQFDFKRVSVYIVLADLDITVPRTRHVDCKIAQIKIWR